MTIQRAGILLISLLGCVCVAHAESPITVDSAWIREAPPATAVLAAYMVINNTGSSTQQVSGLHSPDFKAAEIHRTVVEDGVARMIPVAGITVPAGDSISFEPGGLHVMLFDPRQPLRDGDSATLILQLADGETVTVQAAVIRKTGGYDDHSQHHH